LYKSTDFHVGAKVFFISAVFARLVCGRYARRLLPFAAKKAVRTV
jgi:hypothetical protein